MPHHRPPGVYVSSLFKLLRQCCVRQQDVVNALGVSRAEVSDWATGRRPIRGRFLAPVQDIIGEAIRRLNDHHDHAMQQDPEAVAWWNTAEKTDLATSPYPYLWLDPGQTASVTLSAWWAWHTRMCDLWEEWDLERAQPELIEELDGINRAVSRLNIDGIEKLAASLYDSGQRATFLRLYARAHEIVRGLDRMDARPQAPQWKRALAMRRPSDDRSRSEAVVNQGAALDPVLSPCSCEAIEGMLSLRDPGGKRQAGERAW